MKRFYFYFAVFWLWVLGLISLLLLLYLLVSIAVFVHTSVHVDAVTNWKQSMDDIFKITEIFILSTTAFVALQTYIKSKSVDEVNVSLKIRELLRTQECKEVYQNIDDMNNHLVSNVTEIENYDHKLDEYLSVLEQVYPLYINGVISEEQVIRQFRYRIDSLVKDEYVMKKIEQDEKPFWTDLVSLINKFKTK